MIFTLAAAAVLTVAQANAQKLTIGEKAPELQISEWLTDRPSGNKARFVNFFHSSSGESAAVLSKMDEFARDFAGRMGVVIVGREDKDKVRSAVMKNSPKYHVALDDGGKTFSNFGVKFVPFGVLIDERGKVLWFGNPAQLDRQALEKLLK